MLSVIRPIGPIRPIRPIESNQVSTSGNRQVGGGEGIRTPDPRVANAVLCQLSYAPDKQIRISKCEFQIEGLVAGAGFEPATFGL